MCIAVKFGSGKYTPWYVFILLLHSKFFGVFFLHMALIFH